MCAPYGLASHLRAQLATCDHLRTGDLQVIASASHISICPPPAVFRLDLGLRAMFGFYFDTAGQAWKFSLYAVELSPMRTHSNVHTLSTVRKTSITPTFFSLFRLEYQHFA